MSGGDYDAMHDVADGEMVDEEFAPGDKKKVRRQSTMNNCLQQGCTSKVKYDLTDGVVDQSVPGVNWGKKPSEPFT